MRKGAARQQARQWPRTKMPPPTTMSGKAIPSQEGWNTEVTFTDSGVVNALGAGDSVANNVATGNTLYPLQIDFPRLPTVFGNTLNGNGHDTVLVHGGGPLTHDATMLRYPGVPWRVTQQVEVDSDAVLTLAPRDTVAFDDFAGFIVGSSAPAALRAVSTGGPVLLTATPGHTAWHGVIFSQLSQEDTLVNVIVEKYKALKLSS